MAEAGFPAVDISMGDLDGEVYTDRYLEIANELIEIAKETGIKYVQAHAPDCKGKYRSELVPLFPRLFEFCSLLGIKNIVVHPMMYGPIYENREAHFKANMEFYRSLAPLSRKWGVKIAIENMWDFTTLLAASPITSVQTPRSFAFITTHLTIPRYTRSASTSAT